MTPAETFTSGTYAIVSEDLEMHADAPRDVGPDALLGDTRITVDAAGGDEVFIGLAPAVDVRGFLAQVEHSTLVDIVAGEPLLRTAGGGAPAAPPAAADFWMAQATGPGTQTITWSPENGDWAVVVMNADATAGVDVAVSVGAEVPALPRVIGILLSVAGSLLVLAVPLLVMPLRAVSRESAKPAACGWTKASRAWDRGALPFRHTRPTM